MRIAGIDPHFTRLAFTLINYTERKGRDHLVTDFYKVPNLKDKKSNLKNSAIVNYKLEKIFVISYRWFMANKPDAISIEAYQAIQGKTKHAQKMIAAVVTVKCAAFAAGKIPLEYSSAEMRRHVLGQAKGTKEEMWAAVMPKYNVTDLRNDPAIPDGELEHLNDSLVIAETALLELLEEIKMKGTLSV